jgi:hypothetical protein
MGGEEATWVFNINRDGILEAYVWATEGRLDAGICSSAGLVPETLGCNQDNGLG